MFVWVLFRFGFLKKLYFPLYYGLFIMLDLKCLGYCVGRCYLLFISAFIFVYHDTKNPVWQLMDHGTSCLDWVSPQAAFRERQRRQLKKSFNCGTGIWLWRLLMAVVIACPKPSKVNLSFPLFSYLNFASKSCNHQWKISMISIKRLGVWG